MADAKAPALDAGILETVALIQADTKAWGPRLAELRELRHVASETDARIKDLVEEIRGELGLRGGDDAVAELVDLKCLNEDLKASGLERVDPDRVDLARELLAACRLTTDTLVARFSLRAVKASTHAARIDVSVSVD